MLKELRSSQFWVMVDRWPLWLDSGQSWSYYYFVEKSNTGLQISDGYFKQSPNTHYILRYFFFNVHWQTWSTLTRTSTKLISHHLTWPAICIPFF